MPGRAAGHAITRLWLEPEVRLHDAAAAAIAAFDAAIIGPGSFYTSLMPILPRARRAGGDPARCTARSCSSTNLLTEGRGMWHFTAGEAVRRMASAIGRPIDVVIVNTARPSGRDAGALPRRAQAAARARRRAGVLRGRHAASSGAARSRATIAAGWRRRCGRCSRGGCCRWPRTELAAIRESARRSP